MRRVLAALGLVLVACSGRAPVATPTPSESPSPSPSPSRSPTPRREPFTVDNVMRDVRALAGDIGIREAASPAYREAARYVRRRLESLGYRVRYQRVPVPAGLVDGIPVDAGETLNVVAEPAGFDEAGSHVVVGGHLDTVPDSPGANDNASGIAVMIELARLQRITPLRVPAVFVAFGAEEHRIRGDGFAYGSRAYVRRARARHDGIVGALNLDMVGAGRDVEVLGRGPIFEGAFGIARRLRIPVVRRCCESSDYRAFLEAGIPVAWLWAGDHSTLHTRRDTTSVVQRGEVSRVGRLAWGILRAQRP